MNKHWVEGLDWVRVNEILDIAPELYVQLLRHRLNYLPDTDGEEVAQEFDDIIKQRLPSMDETQRNCVIEAHRLTAEDAKESLDRLTKLLHTKFGQRVVEGPDGQVTLAEGLRIVSRDGKRTNEQGVYDGRSQLDH
jgi:hypothetical protein